MFRSTRMRRQLSRTPNRPCPHGCASKGKPYTWTEFLSEQSLPIPAEEALREVWKDGLGMSDSQIKSGLKALATIAVMSASGGAPHG